MSNEIKPRLVVQEITPYKDQYDERTTFSIPVGRELEDQIRALFPEKNSDEYSLDIRLSVQFVRTVKTFK